MLIAFVHTTFYPTRGKCVPAIVNAIWETVVLASLPSGHITINNSETIKLKVVAMSTMPKNHCYHPHRCTIGLSWVGIGLRGHEISDVLPRIGWAVGKGSKPFLHSNRSWSCVCVLGWWNHEALSWKNAPKWQFFPMFPIRRTFETWQAYWSSYKLHNSDLSCFKAGLSSKAFQLEVNKSFLAHKFKRPIYSLESWLSGIFDVQLPCGNWNRAMKKSMDCW